MLRTLLSLRSRFKQSLQQNKSHRNTGHFAPDWLKVTWARPFIQNKPDIVVENIFRILILKCFLSAWADKLIRLLFYIGIKLFKNFNPYLGRWRRELLKGINRAEPQSPSTYLFFLQSLYKTSVTVFCTLGKHNYKEPQIYN